MRHFITTQNWSQTELQALIDEARRLQQSPIQPLLANKSIALVFFNPSLRTRSSFELGITQLGGHALVLEPGKSAWPIEFTDGVVMDGGPEEHVAEVARVLSRYCDLIAVRAFPHFVDWSLDREDRVIKAFAARATVPVINLETITHPCQELAHMMALQDRLGDVRRKKYVLTWTYHPKPLNTAVANSAVQVATKFGMDVTLLCPSPEFHLDERYLDFARENVEASGGRFEISYDIDSAYAGADAVYAKSWGALPYFGRWEAEKPIRDRYKHFIVDERKMALTNDAVFSHCLPVRRNVKVTDAVIDSAGSLVIDEAENRLHVQKALMHQLLGRFSESSS
ncbi:MAG: N-acetylornithine carbamoyltransferase [Myxococcota bacterium]|jgi:N-acetylornithine carbamoyltransferase